MQVNMPRIKHGSGLFNIVQIFWYWNGGIMGADLKFQVMENFKLKVRVALG